MKSLSIKLHKKIEARRMKIESEAKSVSRILAEEYTKMSRKSINQETIEKRKKQNKIELKIGLNLLNKIGIILILFGISVAAKYSYSRWFNNYARGISFFFIGALLIMGGEWFFRKHKDIFSKGLLGGGVAVLYASIFYSYFVLNILDLNMSLFLSVLVTLSTIILSFRYNSKTVVSFSLVGGYLPFLTYAYNFGMAGDKAYVAMGYLFLLNILILIISIRKKWNLTSYISFIFNIPCLVYLINRVPNQTIAIIYSILTFIVYLGVTLSYPLKYKSRLNVADVMLLGLNTFISCIVIFYLFDKMKFHDYDGFLALLFCAVYVFLGQLIKRIMNQEKALIILFYATSLTFAILMIPFQFGAKWLSMGWLVEGVLLIILGYKNKIKYMERAGLCIAGLCLTAFYFFDFFFGYTFGNNPEFFQLKYFFVMAGMIFVLFAYLAGLKKDEISQFSIRGKSVKIYKYITIINFYLFLMYMGPYYYNKFFVLKDSVVSSDVLEYYRIILISILHIGLAYLLTKIKLVYDDFVKYISIALYFIAIIICLGINTSSPVLKYTYAREFVKYISFGILILFNLYAFLKTRELVIKFIKKSDSSLEFFPLTMSIYLLGVLSYFITSQFEFKNISLIISFLFLILSIGYIIYGFKKRYAYIRFFALALSLFATGKLFIWDLRSLSVGWKIFAYFGFGIILIFISYTYQRIKNEIGVQYEKNKK